MLKFFSTILLILSSYLSFEPSEQQIASNIMVQKQIPPKKAMYNLSLIHI